ncbi:putative peptidyl-tRNA hydrolase PTRHD1, partial [Bienertia sinuspersici]
MRITTAAKSLVPLTLKASFKKGDCTHSKLILLKMQFVGHYTSTETKEQKKMNFDATTIDAKTKAVTLNSLEEEVVVQYVVMRRDLIDTWPRGSVVTQGCHSSIAAIWQYEDDPATLSYFSPSSLDSIHKVTLKVKGETHIINLSEKLKSNGILHKIWIEQPENIPTYLTTKSYPKSMVSPFLIKLKL